MAVLIKSVGLFYCGTFCIDVYVCGVEVLVKPIKILKIQHVYSHNEVNIAYPQIEQLLPSLQM